MDLKIGGFDVGAALTAALDPTGMAQTVVGTQWVTQGINLVAGGQAAQAGGPHCANSVGPAQPPLGMPGGPASLDGLPPPWGGSEAWQSYVLKMLEQLLGHQSAQPPAGYSNDPVPGSPAELAEYKKALETIAQTFPLLDTGGGPGQLCGPDGRLSLDELRQAVGNPDIGPKLQRALEFLATHPERFAELDEGLAAGFKDGKISLGDLAGMIQKLDAQLKAQAEQPTPETGKKPPSTKTGGTHGTSGADDTGKADGTDKPGGTDKSSGTDKSKGKKVGSKAPDDDGGADKPVKGSKSSGSKKTELASGSDLEDRILDKVYDQASMLKEKIDDLIKNGDLTDPATSTKLQMLTGQYNQMLQLASQVESMFHEMQMAIIRNIR